MIYLLNMAVHWIIDLSKKAAESHCYITVLNAMIMNTICHDKMVLFFLKVTYWKSAFFSENTRR